MLTFHVPLADRGRGRGSCGTHPGQGHAVAHDSWKHVRAPAKHGALCSAITLIACESVTVKEVCSNLHASRHFVSCAASYAT